MYLFQNRIILRLELKSLIYSDIKKNRIAKKNFNLLSCCQINALCFCCPVQLNKMNRFEKKFVIRESCQIICDKKKNKLEVKSDLDQYPPKKNPHNNCYTRTIGFLS